MISLWISAIAIAATLTVPGDYADLEQAMSASVSGDIIELSAGTYSAPDAIQHDLAIIGVDGASSTFIVPFDTRPTLITGLSNVTLTELTVSCSAAGGIDLVGGSSVFQQLAFEDCATAAFVVDASGDATLTVRDSTFADLPTAGAVFSTHTVDLSLQNLSFQSPGIVGIEPLVDSVNGTWDFTDVQIRDVRRTVPVLRGIGLDSASWQRLEVACTLAGDTTVELQATNITANAVLAWKNDNSDGTVFDLDGTANLDHMTVLGTGSQTLVNLTAGVSNVTQSAFAGEGTAVSTTASASVFGAYNLFDGVTIAGGTALEASLASTAGVLAPPDFRAWTPDSPSCDVDVLAPNPSSPLIADCAPEDASIHPDAEEIPYDGIDQDCNGDDLVDVDQDGVPGFQAGGEDCDDNDPTVSPFVDEDLSAIDRDCDGHTDPTDPLRPATCSQSARGPATPGTFILLLCGLLFLRGKQPLREPRRRPLFLPL